MKSAKLFGKEDIRMIDVDIPKINDHELLIKVKAASICGTDIRMYRNGRANIDKDHPVTLGHEFAGIIEKRGEYVNPKFEIGAPVTVAPNIGCGTCVQCMSGDTHLCKEFQALGIHRDGAFAEYIVIPENAVNQGNVMFIEDDTISFEEIALIEPLSCVYNGQEQLNIGPGDNVLIVGGGAIGVMHAFMALAHGASNVFLNDRHDERLAAINEIEPAIHTISMQSNMKEEVYRLTKGIGMDVVIVAAPAPDIQSNCLEWLNTNGRVSFFGGIPKDKEMVPLNTNLVHYKQLLLTGSTGASLSHFYNSLEMVRNRVFQIEKLITNHYSIEQFPDALASAQSSQGFKNVIIFD